MPDLSRRHLLLTATAALAAPALVGRAEAQSFVEAAFPGRGSIDSGMQATVTRISTRQPLVALTFDDGPHHSLTPQLLDLLAGYNIRATFYVIGSRVAQHPQLAARIASEGHEIGNHTWSHPSLFGHSDASILNQVDRTNEAVMNAVGRIPVTMRPPYGNLYPQQRLMLHAARGMPTVLWSVDPEDWRRPGSSVVAQRIVNRSHPGDVVLAHDIHGATVRAMPATIEGLASRGFRFVTVSELIGWPRWDSRRMRIAARSQQG
ncbi:polysaccharide deacetylase family protein [Roseibacterium sp. SDUM158016]|uniref:polysaccharide deacetylase family protein n=1 Tax=Roseicyclus sediminis TaxID=2980997 RepID=UPI0021D34FD4|nr:polysaccharide deacetylase family protein [Roseibacterium sp. SDUM158016]MCU4651779.1 polysaccharide deacetylase family protein [Roseibacterium sp. SDUM158016]